MNPEEKALREEFNLKDGDLIDSSIGLLDIFGANETHIALGNLSNGEIWSETHQEFRDHMNGVKRRY